MLYCLICFIVGWLASRMMGNGFSVGGDVSCDGHYKIGSRANVMNNTLNEAHDHAFHDGGNRGIFNITDCEDIFIPNFYEDSEEAAKIICNNVCVDPLAGSDHSCGAFERHPYDDGWRCKKHASLDMKCKKGCKG